MVAARTKHGTSLKYLAQARQGNRSKSTKPVAIGAGSKLSPEKFGSLRLYHPTLDGYNKQGHWPCHA